MRRLLGALVRRAAAAGGYTLVRPEQLGDLHSRAAAARKIDMLGMVSDAHLREALALLPHSMAQLNQDFFALEANGWKRGGYFVEFGATDGRTLSNSWLLEKQFGWSGLLAEPARVWRGKLAAADRSAAKDYDCVWRSTGETLTFRETAWPEISTLEDLKDADFHDRSAGHTYEVSTISLADLLDRHHAPEVIDYLSIDTEGSELAILEAYDFAARRIRCITAEHNFTPEREQLFALLSAKGYRRVHQDLSEWDDWYVLT